MEWEDVKHNKDIALLLKKNRGKGGGSMIKETIQAVEDAEAKASELVARLRRMHAALRRRRRQKRIECSQMHRKGGKKQL